MDAARIVSPRRREARRLEYVTRRSKGAIDTFTIGLAQGESAARGQSASTRCVRAGSSATELHPTRSAAIRRGSSASGRPRRVQRPGEPRRGRARHPVARVRRRLLYLTGAIGATFRADVDPTVRVLLGPTASGKSGPRSRLAALSLPSACGSKSCAATRRRSTAAWTSAPPSRAAAERAPCRTT